MFFHYTDFMLVIQNRLFPFFIALCLLMPSCASVIKYHGNDAPNKKLNALRTQISSRDNSIQLLGTPSVTSLDGKRLWLYISQIDEAFISSFSSEKSRRIVALYFDKDDIIKKKIVLTKADGRDINFTLETVPPPTPELNWLQRLFGNIGRVTPGNIPQGSSTP